MRYYRKIIRIRGEDSPNVRLALAQVARGLPVTHEVLVPGVLTYREYRKRRATWDAVRQCVSLDAQFYQGSELLLFPPLWLNAAEALAAKLRGARRQAKAGGCDPAEGGDRTAMAAVDECGLIELVSRPTRNTADIPKEALAFMRKHSIPPERFGFDRGGGGKQAADRLRDQGYPVRTIGFGDPVSLELKHGRTPIAVRRENKEEAYEYVSRRAQMYWELSQLCDPAEVEFGGPDFWRDIFRGQQIPRFQGFAIPVEYGELRKQLAPIPKLYNEEGRAWMLPKHSSDKNKNPNGESKKDERTLVQLIGHSPDESDAVLVATHMLYHRLKVATAGALVMGKT